MHGGRVGRRGLQRDGTTSSPARSEGWWPSLCILCPTASLQALPCHLQALLSHCSLQNTGTNREKQEWSLVRGRLITCEAQLPVREGFFPWLSHTEAPFCQDFLGGCPSTKVIACVLPLGTPICILVPFFSEIRGNVPDFAPERAWLWCTLSLPAVTNRGWNGAAFFSQHCAVATGPQRLLYPLSGLRFV